MFCDNMKISEVFSAMHMVFTSLIMKHVHLIFLMICIRDSFLCNVLCFYPFYISQVLVLLLWTFLVLLLINEFKRIIERKKN